MPIGWIGRALSSLFEQDVTPTVTRGFMRDADGTTTTFDVAGGIWTEPEGIDAAGNITGFYELVAGVPRGFLRYADGRILTFDPPPSLTGMPPEAQPVSISDFDDIAPRWLLGRVYRSSAGVLLPGDYSRGHQCRGNDRRLVRRRHH